MRIENLLVLGFLSAAGCYHPQASTDAQINAVTNDSAPIDSDSDGVVDLTDNCPARANPNQHDEDQDRLGDVCDPCPISTNNADTDGDGVGDDCEFIASTPLHVDEILIFEGFGGTAIPADWQRLGSLITVENDRVVLDAINDDLGALLLKKFAGTTKTAQWLMSFDVVTANANSVVMVFASGGKRICFLNDRFLKIGAGSNLQSFVATQTVISPSFGSVLVGNDIRVRSAAVGDLESCAILSRAGVAELKTQVNTNNGFEPTVGINVANVKIAVNWAMLVGSP
jgi:hypothetical protein